MDLLSILSTIPDHRDRQGREYRLEHILLFSILALLSNAKGYTDIERFIAAHFEELKSIFKLKWRRVPHFSAIRKIIVGLDPIEIEKAFETAASQQDNLSQEKGQKHYCFDGKALTVAFPKSAIKEPCTFSKSLQLIAKLSLLTCRLMTKTVRSLPFKSCS